MDAIKGNMAAVATKKSAMTAMESAAVKGNKMADLNKVILIIS